MDKWKIAVHSPPKQKSVSYILGFWKKYFLKNIQHFREEFEKLYKRPDETMRFRVVHRAIGRVGERKRINMYLFMGKREFFSSVRPPPKTLKEEMRHTRGFIWYENSFEFFQPPAAHRAAELKFILMGAVWSLIMFFKKYEKIRIVNNNSFYFPPCDV